MVDGVRFVWLRTPSYRRNGALRVVNMLAFAASTRWGRWRRLVSAPHVIVGSSPHPFAAFAAQRLAHSLSVPFVFEIRDFWPQSLIDLGNLSRLHPFILVLSAIERHLLARAAEIVTPLPCAREYLVRRGVDGERVHWVPNGVDGLPKLAPAPVGGSRPFTIVYAGAHGLANGLDVVLDAAAHLQRIGPDVPIVFRLVGDGSEKPRLETRAAAEGIANVRFAPPVPKRDVPAMLAEADACLLILKDSPVFRWGVSPNKLFDYMAAARPVIFAVNAPNNPVADAEAGLTVRAGDPIALSAAAIAMARSAPEEREAMGLRGRALVAAEYTQEHLALRFEAALEAALLRAAAGRDVAPRRAFRRP
jgi:glycosyltransferase involved in cell wall biosynthesis